MKHPAAGGVQWVHSATDGAVNHGIIRYNRALTEREMYSFELTPVYASERECVETLIAEVAAQGGESIEDVKADLRENIKAYTEANFASCPPSYPIGCLAEQFTVRRASIPSASTTAIRCSRRWSPTSRSSLGGEARSVDAPFARVACFAYLPRVRRFIAGECGTDRRGREGVTVASTGSRRRRTARVPGETRGPRRTPARPADCHPSRRSFRAPTTVT